MIRHVDLRSMLEPEKPWEQRPFSAITTVVVHHSATGENSDPVKTIRAFDRYHKSKWGHGIAYHWVISQDGTAYWTSRHVNITYHSGNSNVNKHSIGICLIGNYASGEPTRGQLMTLKALIQYLKHDAPMVKVKKSLAHYEVVGTTCPGRWWDSYKNWLDAPVENQPSPLNHSLLTLHFQLGLPHWSGDFLNHVRWAKLMDPGDAKPPGDTNWIIRFWEKEDIAAAEVMKGAQGANERFYRWFAELEKRPWLSDDNIWLSHMNEPSNAHILKSATGRAALNAFTAEYAKLLRKRLNIKSCGYDLGVGHPEPHQAAEVFKSGLPALIEYEGIWGQHEYGYPTVLTFNPDGTPTTHHTLRLTRRILPALRATGMKHFPRAHITEAGIDRLLTGIVGGWKQLNNDPHNYVAQLAHYDHELRLEPIVEAVYIFTASPQLTWLSYGIEEADAEVLLNYIISQEGNS